MACMGVPNKPHEPFCRARIEKLFESIPTAEVNADKSAEPAQAEKGRPSDQSPNEQQGKRRSSETLEATSKKVAITIARGQKRRSDTRLDLDVDDDKMEDADGDDNKLVVRLSLQ